MTLAFGLGAHVFSGFTIAGLNAVANLITAHYTPPSFVEGERLRLPEEEARHAVRVLRRRPGDEVVVVDGEGGWFRVRLDRVDKKHASGIILERRENVGEPDYDLVVGIAVLKNPNRFETFLEKAVELGVTAVAPLLTARTEKTVVKASRAHRIMVAAMKQCGRSRLPRLVPAEPFAAFLEADPPELGVICHEKTGTEEDLLSALRARSSVRRVRVLVGPEGGFTDDEVEAAERVGYRAVSLGSRRLRAETAGIAAATAVMLAHSDESR
ncbi:RsmE family RNA methyltransferase [Rhodocaloribacter sp.]